jgi:hypothetical protein
VTLIVILSVLGLLIILLIFFFIFRKKILFSFKKRRLSENIGELCINKNETEDEEMKEECEQKSEREKLAEELMRIINQ